MMIERKQYLNQLISKKENGMIKVITGIRRCGKSYLLFEIYHKYLNSIGIDDNHIIELALEEKSGNKTWGYRQDIFRWKKYWNKYMLINLGGLNQINKISKKM